MRIYDVTVPIYSGMPVYEGDPEVSIRRWLSLDEGGEANVSHLSLGSHTGTHVDAPLHFRSGAPGVDQLPLDVLIGPARVYDVPGAGDIDLACLRGVDLASQRRILFKTRNSAARVGGRFGTDFAALAPEAARLLVEAGVRLVGLDGPSADPFRSADFPAHHALLDAGVIILEGLDLSAVPPGDYELLCLPLKLLGGDGAPARVLLRGQAHAPAPSPVGEAGYAAESAQGS
ncbi:MAG TPA: cyclase family protein [Candidatus Methylomirabilis sp.]|nr:cyclase family protein [Candidatus Methylomirabilis sp.]